MSFLLHYFAVPLISMWTETCLDNNIPLMREMQTNVMSDGAPIISQDDGYIISVPPGAISKGLSITLKHGVVPHGAFDQFEFPEGVTPVSAVLSVQCPTKRTFLKPISIALPHFMNCETSDDCNKLAVFKACHASQINVNGRKKYQFKEMPKERLTLFTVRNKKAGLVLPYAAYSSNHCCYWCVGTYNKTDTDKAMFCLTEAKPKLSDELETKEFNIHYCLSYYLPTCLKVKLVNNNIMI